MNLRFHHVEQSQRNIVPRNVLMAIELIAEKWIELKRSVHNAEKSFMLINARNIAELIVLMNVPTKRLSRKRFVFARIAGNRLPLIHHLPIFAVHGDVVLRGQRQLTGPRLRKFFASAFSVVRNFIEVHQLLQILEDREVANSVLASVVWLLGGLTILLLQAFTVPGHGIRHAKESLNGTIILVSSAVLRAKVWLFTMWNLKEMAERKETIISLPYAHIATG